MNEKDDIAPTTRIDPPVVARFWRNNRFEYVAVIESLVMDGIKFNKIVFKDGTNEIVPNNKLTFKKGKQ